MILVKSFFAHNSLRNYSYLIIDKASGAAWVIDPYDAEVLTQYIKKEGLILKGILNTHQHSDHIQGNRELSEAFRAPVMKLKSSETIRLEGNHVIETLDTPGHTLDHQVFIWKSHEEPVALFSGDTLFNSGVGNCRGGGDVGLLFETTQMLLRTLPPQTFLYPGHDYRKTNLAFAQSVDPENDDVQESLRAIAPLPTEDLPPVTLQDELRVNPFLRLSSQSLRQNVMGKQLDLSDPNQAERELFIKLRALRDRW